MANVSATMTLDGFAELSADLKKIAGEELKNVVAGALKAGGERIESAARAKCPVDEGKLVAQINATEALRYHDAIVVYINAGKGVAAPGNQGFAADAFYGKFVEYGHKVGRRARNKDLAKLLAFPLRGRKTRTKDQQAIIKFLDSQRPDVRAKPFMRPAFDEQKDKAAALLDDAVDAFLTKTFNR